VHGRDIEAQRPNRGAYARGAETGDGSREHRPIGLRRGRRAIAGLTNRGLVAALLGAIVASASSLSAAAEPSLAQIIASSPSADWRPLDARTTLYLDIPGGRVVVELAPRFAPNHVANIERLTRAHFFDGLFIVRSQDNYVVQWGDAEAKRPLGGGQDRAQGRIFAPSRRR
jgi:hypothetical protein